MLRLRSLARPGLVLVGLLLITAAAAVAQLQTRTLYRKISDPTGTVLPLVTVTLSAGQGSLASQAAWLVEGVVIAAMAATGGSPGYSDFDAFEEMQSSTGGSVSTIASGGVVLNLVTKRGPNEYRGSARYLQAPGGAQSSTGLKKSDLPAAQQPSFLGRAANKINKVEDFGGEIGGPIVQDHLWASGPYREQKE